MNSTEPMNSIVTKVDKLDWLCTFFFNRATSPQQLALERHKTGYDCDIKFIITTEIEEEKYKVKLPEL